MATYYVIRAGWNSENQPAIAAKDNPKNRFESLQYRLLAIVEAESEEEACEQNTFSVYNGQCLFATKNIRSIKGLTKAVENWLWERSYGAL